MIFFSVLYNPDENAIKNIILANNAGLKSVVYLNQVNDQYLNRLPDLDVVMLGDNKNVGLGLAFYELEEYLAKTGDEHYVYFDQDTITTEETWELILRTYTEVNARENAGLIFYGKNVSERSDLVVSSGCLFSMAVIRKIGRHDKDYFVEGVDYEFCLRLKINGLFIYNIFTNSIDHFALQDGKSLKFAGFQMPIRVYGFSRTKDFNISHFKLLRDSLKNKQYYMFYRFLKSSVIFNVREYFSRFITRFL
ncbi:hypothetical protein ACFOSD_07925 [Salinispirillum marinum]|uniref:Glycosyltransferase 2-like domain-containing protein n=2 Tax=Saccharospirillaceae TaxID=255527 RepID=A0ABV8BD28_9GAMM